MVETVEGDILEGTGIVDIAGEDNLGNEEVVVVGSLDKHDTAAAVMDIVGKD